MSRHEEGSARMADNPPPTGDNVPEPAQGGGRWRGPLIAALVAVPILVAAGGARLGCDAGVVDVALCGNNAQVSSAVPDAQVEAGQTTVTVADPGAAPV